MLIKYLPCLHDAPNRLRTCWDSPKKPEGFITPDWQAPITNKVPSQVEPSFHGTSYLHPILTDTPSHAFTNSEVGDHQSTASLKQGDTSIQAAPSLTDASSKEYARPSSVVLLVQVDASIQTVPSQGSVSMVSDAVGKQRIAMLERSLPALAKRVMSLTDANAAAEALQGAGCFKPLVALLDESGAAETSRTSTAVVQEVVETLYAAASVSGTAVESICAAGGIKPLVRLLKEGTSSSATGERWELNPRPHPFFFATSRPGRRAVDVNPEELTVDPPLISYHTQVTPTQRLRSACGAMCP